MFDFQKVWGKLQMRKIKRKSEKKMKRKKKVKESKNKKGNYVNIYYIGNMDEFITQKKSFL